MEIPFHKPYITDDEVTAVIECLRSGWLTMGHKTVEFEKLFREYVGCRNAVSVNSGTAALHLALLAAGIVEGDEVIIPAMTFAAGAEVVKYLKAVPVLVDIERETRLMDVSALEEKITPVTRAIMPMHYGGQPCDMEEIIEIAEAHNLVVIEDAAHSLPSLYRGDMVGAIGNLTCFSFYATKTLTTGEGGMVTTNNDDFARRMSNLRLHGISRDAWQRQKSDTPWRYDVTETGYKYNTTDIASAIGVEQLKKLETMWEMRKRIAEAYSSAFADMAEVTLYRVKEDRETSWYLYPVILNTETLSISRDRFIVEMLERGIQLSVHFIPLYRFSCYSSDGYDPANFGNSEWAFERSVSLPIFPGMTGEEVGYVIDNMRDVLKSGRK